MGIIGDELHTDVFYAPFLFQSFHQVIPLLKEGITS
jgi:hypothetical protein